MNPETLEIYKGEKRQPDDIELTGDQAETLTALRDQLGLKPTTPTVGRKYLEKRIRELEERLK